MKKLIIIMVIAIAILDYGCRKAEEYVITGQLWGTGRHDFPEKIKGKVQEMRMDNFWAKEESGKIVRGDAYTNLGVIEKYNPSGTILSAVYLDSLGGTNPNLWSVQVEADGKIINKAMYYTRDTLRAYSKNTYAGNNLTEAKFFDPDNDTLLASVVYTYDQNGNRIKGQMFSSKNEPLQYVEFIYSAEGFQEHMKRYSAQGKMTVLYDYINDNGNKVSEHIENFINKTVTDNELKYEYDKKGNWIKRVYYRDNKPIWFTEREIRYYE